MKKTMSHLNSADSSHNLYANLQSAPFQNTMQDFAKVESFVQAQTAGVNLGWPNTIVAPALEGEFSQHYSTLPSQNQPVFINTPITAQPPITLATPTHYFQTTVPVPQIPVQLTTAPISAPRQSGNPFHVNPRLYRFVIPRGSYQGNDNVKKFLTFFNELNHNQKSLVNGFMAFQFEKITTKIAEQHNKEVQSLKEEILALKEQIKERPTLDELESNTELTTSNYHTSVVPWDALSIQRIIDDDLTTLGGYPEDEDQATPMSDEQRSVIISNRNEDDLGKMSFRATTQTGFAKVRAQKLPHFDQKLISEVKRLSAMDFLTSYENRENGDAFYLLAGLIQNLNPQASFAPLVVNKIDIMRAFSRFKAFKRQTQ